MRAVQGRVPFLTRPNFKCCPVRTGRIIRVSCLNSGTGDAGIEGASRVMQNNQSHFKPTADMTTPLAARAASNGRV
jgi:hypothetical protein